MQSIEQKAKQIIAEVLEVNEIQLTPEVGIGDIDSWDSVRQLIIITSLEESFDISFPEDVLFELTNIETILAQIEAILNARQ